MSDPAADETLDRRKIAEFRQFNAPDAHDLTLMLIDEFINDASSQVEMLSAARQRRDDRALKATAHSLKGSSMTMGATRLARLCTQIEILADRPDGAVTSGLMTELEQEFLKVRDAFETERQGASQG